MDNSVSVQERTPTKRSGKSKKKPIKVVYISNPMRVKATASEFRALVQELTGQDAELPTDLSRFQNPTDSDGGHQTDSDNSVTKSSGHESDHTFVMPQVDPNNNFEGQLGSCTEGFEPFDDHHVFAPHPHQMMDDISAFLPPTIFYESAQVDELLSRLDADAV